MIYILCIKRGEAGVSTFACGDGLNVRDNELASSEVTGVAREHLRKSRGRA